MFLALRPHRLWQGAILLLALVLGASSFWILTTELLRPGIHRLPTNRDAAALAAGVRMRSALAAGVGGVRGDLRSESAFTYAILLYPDTISGGNQPAIGAKTQSVVDRSLAYAPFNPDLWLLASALATRFNWARPNAALALKMSYYTGPNELSLVPLRLRVATNSSVLGDSEIQQFVRRDVRMILTRWPDLKDALIGAYRAALPDARAFIEDAVSQVDRDFIKAIRAGNGL
jgi:hypothetical protein